MKILVAFDESLDARSAIRYGIKKVREYGGELIAVCVFPKHLFTDYEAVPEAEEIARRESFNRVDEALGLIGEGGRDINAHLVIVTGRPEDKILAYAKAEKVDLIVLPPSLLTVAEKACCLTDIVSVAEETDSGLSDVCRGHDGFLKART